jgi:hypothetical protein
LEAVLADRVERLELDAQLGLERPAGLAEEIADHRRHQGRRGRRVPGEAALADRCQRATEVRGSFEQRDLVAELGQPGGRRHPAEPATDHHHPRHGRQP